jgi:hypothetical protein
VGVCALVARSHSSGEASPQDFDMKALSSQMMAQL